MAHLWKKKATYHRNRVVWLEGAATSYLILFRWNLFLAHILHLGLGITNTKKAIIKYFFSLSFLHIISSFLHFKTYVNKKLIKSTNLYILIKYQSVQRVPDKLHVNHHHLTYFSFYFSLLYTTLYTFLSLHVHSKRIHPRGTEGVHIN